MCWLFVGRELPAFEQVHKAAGHIARKLSDSLENTQE
jgi:hypothetical protein